jgi:hypothetical protein
VNAAQITPAAAAEEAHAVLHVALGLTWPDDREARRAVGRAVWDLHDALEIWALLTSGGLHWEAEYPHLSVTADPDSEALAKAAGEAQDAARMLVRLLAEHCWPEVAALTGVTI